MIDIEVKNEDKCKCDIKQCKSDIKRIKNDIDGINTDISILRIIEIITFVAVIAFLAFGATNLQHRLDKAEVKIKSMQNMKDDISDLEADLDDLKDRISTLESSSAVHDASIEVLNKNQLYISKTVDNMKEEMASQEENADE